MNLHSLAQPFSKKAMELRAMEACTLECSKCGTRHWYVVKGGIVCVNCKLSVSFHMLENGGKVKQPC